MEWWLTQQEWEGTVERGGRKSWTTLALALFDCVSGYPRRNWNKEKEVAMPLCKNAFCSSQMQSWSPTHRKDVVIVWEWVRPVEKNLWYEEMLNKFVLFLLGERGYWADLKYCQTTTERWMYCPESPWWHCGEESRFINSSCRARLWGVGCEATFDSCLFFIRIFHLLSLIGWG